MTPGTTVLGVPVDQADPSLPLQASEHCCIDRIDPAGEWFPVGPDIVFVFGALQPHPGPRKEISAIHAIPVDMGDDDIGDVLRAGTGFLDRSGRLDEVHRLPLREKLVAIEAGVEQYDV